MWTKFAQKLIEIVNTSKKYSNNLDALKYIKDQMEKIIYPELKSYMCEAYFYSTKRDIENMRKSKNINEIFCGLNELASSIKFSVIPLIMSSYQAKLNLIDDSDLDIGFLVENLDDMKLDVLHNCLEKNGYKFIREIGQKDTNNYYLSYQKYIYGIEVEVKVRDKCKSKSIIDLHYFLDNNLSEEERSLFTYAKYELKKLGDQIGYKCMKKLIYEYGFSRADINNGFLFIM